MENITFKPKFIERYEKLTDFEKFKEYSLKYLRRSIRVNTIKISISELKIRMEKNWNFKQIPWCKEGFWLEHKKGRRDIGNTLEHQLGYIYIQEAASMIPPLILDPAPHELILDLCAAPGSKATQISQYMENTGLLLANDYRGIRLSPLGINMQRMGISNSVITLMDGHWYKDFEFDKILVDAPCSGTGTIRKSFKTLRIWNPNSIKRLAGTQKQLIETAFNNLKHNGIMVYSTCSCEPEENEAIVNFLIDKYPNAKVMDTKLTINRSKPILNYDDNEYSKEINKCLRIWPQDNDTEGFFVAKNKKRIKHL